MKKIILGLFLMFTSILTLNHSIFAQSDHKAQNGKDIWSGKYRQQSGLHELYLEKISKDSLSVDLVKVNQNKDSDGSHFIAKIKGRKAMFREEPECQVDLIREKEGVKVIDRCGGPEDELGFYKSLER